MSERILKAIFFDLDETLFPTGEFTELARKEAVRAMRGIGLNVPFDECYKELLEVIDEFGSNYSHHFEKLLRRLPDSCLRGVNPAVIVASAVKAYHDCKRDSLKPYDDAIEVLQVLKKAGLKLGIVTHGLEFKQAEKLLRLDLYKLLAPEAIFITEQIGISKPNPKLYLRVCSSLGLIPSEVMYVGDNPLHDVDPANAAGLISVRIKRGGKHDSVNGETMPSYEVTTFHELLEVVRNDFSVEID